MTGDGGPRIIYCGMFGALSRVPLAALLAAGVGVRAVVVPGEARGGRDGAVQPLTPPPGWAARPSGPTAALHRTIVELAWERGIPALAVDRLDGAAVAALAAFAPDLIAVSCFPARFPPALLALPPLGCLNLHPAPLPRGRGPAPLFWAFREGWERGGVTVHLLDEGLDSGPIVARADVALSDGLTGAELELRCAALGAELLGAAVRDLAASAASPTPQDEARATSQPWPRAADFIVTLERPARWAFNFIRGTAGWGHPHLLAVGDERFVVHAARGYDPAARLDAPIARDGDLLRVQCAPGVLTVAVATAAKRD